MRFWSLNTIGTVLISLVILSAIIGCFYLVTKENTAVFFTARISGNEVAAETKEELPKTIVFVGDIMLDRGVEYQILKHSNNYFYPFEKIQGFLSEFDIVFGNLEGPIVENPPVFSEDSLMFAFNKETAGALSKAGLNVLSLANNHTDNLFMRGLWDTRNFLAENSIDYVGEPSGCQQGFILEKQSVLFLAFNQTYPLNCPNEEIAEVVRTIRTQNPSNFLIVSLHWGKEYQATSSVEQQALAHQLIDAGADLLIGHHPHVVQNIELYKDKLIFYSLGNFIFDQYFSKETQEGLAVGLEIHPSKLVYHLFPVFVGKGQPSLMEKAKKKEFLQGLAERSGEELFRKIRLGKLRMPRAH